jgi:hypothetical protein
MLLRRGPRHVRARPSFGRRRDDDGLSGHRADAGDGLEQCHGLFHRRVQVIDLSCNWAINSSKKSRWTRIRFGVVGDQHPPQPLVRQLLRPRSPWSVSTRPRYNVRRSLARSAHRDVGNHQFSSERRCDGQVRRAAGLPAGFPGLHHSQEREAAKLLVC